MASASRLLLIATTERLVSVLEEQFAVPGEFGLEVVDSATAALARLVQAPPIDGVLIDGDGSAGPALRDGGYAGPLLTLVPPGGRAPQAGESLQKPFRFAVLTARLRSLVREYEQSDEATSQIGPFLFQPAARTLTGAEGSVIRLTDKEAAILRFLGRSRGQKVDRETLLEEVWGYNSGVTTHTLETHVYRLRQKIEPEDGQARLLLTSEGGYTLAPQDQSEN